ncbi:MAG: glycerol-3-phosphate 1-O-acyltransferase PlsY [Eubacteriales bacterium]|nr:glycerol-3-phosphate 1-O-acyltransferase PlsY [Eubacteriales bacterium]
MPEEITWRFVLAIVIAYCLGSISPSTLIGRAHGIDIKKEGSGNAGTTNALRVLGWKAALVTVIIDIGKGVLAVLIAGQIGDRNAMMAAAFAAFIGHIWPVFLKFKGGKGIAVAFGVIVTLNPKLGFTLLLLIIIIVLATRKVSFGSIIDAAVFPILCWFWEPDFFWYSLIMAVIVIIKHRSNIQRLIRGEESNINIKWLNGDKNPKNKGKIEESRK